MAGPFKNQKGESYSPGDLVEWDGVSYSIGGKIRSLPVSQGYLQQLMSAVQATDPGLQVKIVSAGQAPKGSGGKRTGSTRHDVGPDGYSKTSDLILVRNGREIRPGDDKGLYSKFLQNAASAGFTGIGHYSWGVHIGDGKPAAWGPSTTSRDLDPVFAKAIEAGRKSYASGVKLPMVDIPGASPTRPATMPAMLRTPNSADEVVRDFEDFRAEPYNDMGSLRIGFGSDTVTRADGTVERVRPGMTVTREDAQRDLERRLPEFEQKIIKQVGTEAWNKLPRESQSAVKSMAYNYGSLGGLPSLVRAIKSGDQNAIADEVAARAGDNGGINEKRRKAEAALIRKGIAPTPAQMSAGVRGAPAAPGAASDGAAGSSRPRTAQLPSGGTVEAGRSYQIGGETYIGGIDENGAGTLRKADAGILSEAGSGTIAGNLVDLAIKDAAASGLQQVRPAAASAAGAIGAGASDLAGKVGGIFGGMFGGDGQAAPPRPPAVPSASVPRTPPRTMREPYSGSNMRTVTIQPQLRDRQRPPIMPVPQRTAAAVPQQTIVGREPRLERLPGRPTTQDALRAERLANIDAMERDMAGSGGGSYQSSPQPTQSQMQAMRLLPTSSEVDRAMASNGTTGPGAGAIVASAYASTDAGYAGGAL